MKGLGLWVLRTAISDAQGKLCIVSTGLLQPTFTSLQLVSSSASQQSLTQGRADTGRVGREKTILSEASGSPEPDGIPGWEES